MLASWGWGEAEVVVVVAVKRERERARREGRCIVLGWVVGSLLLLIK